MTWISFVMVACIWHDMLAFAEYLLLAASGVFAYGLRTVIGVGATARRVGPTD